jgi:hypothetical protein
MDINMTLIDRILDRIRRACGGYTFRAAAT